jgi:hypothetical protein
MAERCFTHAKPPDAHDTSSGVGVMSDSSSSVLPLEQVAAILAAEQEGFAIEEILAVEGVSEEAWTKARASWLDQATSDPSVHQRYAAALVAAQDRLHCDVTPLFDHVSAWIALLRAFPLQPRGELLSKHRLTLGDLARLERHWRQKFAASAALSKEASELRSASDPPALPALHVGERKLVPSPYAGGISAKKDTKSDASPEPPPARSQTEALQAIDPIDLDRLAAAVAASALPVPPSSGERALLDTIDADATLKRHFQRRVDHFRRTRQQSKPDVGAAPPAAEALPPGFGPPAETADIDITCLDPAPLPFRDGPAVPPPLLDLPRPERDPLTMTATLDPSSAGPVMPFASAAAAAMPVKGTSGAAASANLTHAPELTLAQYASYCAELSLYGGAHAATVAQRYGVLSTDAHQELVAAWSKRFVDSPGTRALHDQLFEHYRHWLLRFAAGGGQGREP